MSAHRQDSLRQTLKGTDLVSGTPVRLPDFKGQWVVIEAGSSTCSMYTKNIPGMAELRGAHPDVRFLVVYVREAHPGERLRQHKNFDEKLAAAKLLKPKYDENRQILVDSHDGGFHRMYGMKPNLIYVIRPDGVVHYRCDWAHVSGLKNALEEREKSPSDRACGYEKAACEPRHGHRHTETLWTGGIIALGLLRCDAAAR
ncbi:MAG: hypothetical protein CM1200mP36_08200 [Gammaproteobacteria bacterium]|nr:MAG: hypothetical protein CM1200mP36_08200 [Gammaproteobacteria bacterium]